MPRLSPLLLLVPILALATPTAEAQSRCERTITLVNTSSTHSIHVEEALSRTRVNATWTDLADHRRLRVGRQACIASTGENWQGNCGFIASAAANASARFTAYYRVAGCGVARRTRIVYTCVQNGYVGPLNGPSRTIDLHGGAYADPRDMTLRIGC